MLIMQATDLLDGNTHEFKGIKGHDAESKWPSVGMKYAKKHYIEPFEARYVRLYPYKSSGFGYQKKRSMEFRMVRYMPEYARASHNCGRSCLLWRCHLSGTISCLCQTLYCMMMWAAACSAMQLCSPFGVLFSAGHLECMEMV